VAAAIRSVSHMPAATTHGDFRALHLLMHADVPGVIDEPGVLASGEL
jgi:hypothetical protein